MYQGWYNTYERRKMSRVAMSEVISKEKNHEQTQKECPRYKQNL